MAGEVAEGLVHGGQVVGGGLGLWGILRFVRWLIEFLYKRLDVRVGRLDAREKALEERFNTRLAHVETELHRYRMATMRLVNRIAEIMPQDPVLLEVANILREAVPMPDENAELESLIRRVRRTGE